MNSNIFRWMLSLLLAGGIAIMAGGIAGAQTITFQGRYGGPLSNDYAKGGIVMVGDGSYMVVGESDSLTADNDVYVAHILRCGTLDWAYTYDIGGHDAGRKIRKTPDGGYIIVGSTENLDNEHCTTTNDAFLLKIGATGLVQWVQVYGGDDDDQGYDVQLYGNGYILAGFTNSFGAGFYDAMLISTNGTGGVNWAWTYGGTSNDYFYSLDIDGNEVVAVGSSLSFAPPPPLNFENIFLHRVAAGTGVGVAPFPVLYGLEGLDVGRCVMVCANGELVIVGYTSSVGSILEGYMLRTTAAGAYLNDRAFGGSTQMGRDEFYEVQEWGNAELIVVGSMERAPGGFGATDMYVGHYTAGFANITHTLHGGTGLEAGHSIVADDDLALPAPQWIAAGYTQGSFSADPDVYVVRQWYTGVSGCNDDTPTVSVAQPRLKPWNVTPTTEDLDLGCCARACRLCKHESDILCQACEDDFLRGDSPDISNLILRDSKNAAQVRRTVVHESR